MESSHHYHQSIASEFGINNSCNSLSSSSSLLHSDQSTSLIAITNKLGHDLEEIRQRSLDSLESKLDNQLINEDDLGASSRDLFIKLLEILKKPECSRQHEKVIGILKKLIKCKAAVNNLLFVNGLSVLNKLKVELNETRLRGDVEYLVEHLMDKIAEFGSNMPAKSTLSFDSSQSFHSLDSDKSIKPQLISSSHSQISNSSQTSHENTLLAYSNNNSNNSQNSMTNNNDKSNTISHKSNLTKSVEISKNIEQVPLVSEQLGCSNFSKNSSLITSSSLHKTTNAFNINDSIPKSFFSFEKSNGTTHTTNTTTTTNGFYEKPEITRQTVYYWLPLTQMDKQFLSTTENTLKSGDSKKIKSYCTFMQTIVFNDFPAEIFLQRSTILKILIDLTVKYTNSSQQTLANNNNNNSQKSSSSTQTDYLNEESSLLKSLITCFHYYCVKLKKRINYIKDPSTFCCKDFYSNGFEFLSKSIQMNSNRCGKFDGPNSHRSNAKSTSYKDNLMNASLYSTDNSVASSGLSSIKSSSNSSLSGLISGSRQQQPIKKTANNKQPSAQLHITVGKKARDGLNESDSTAEFPHVDELLINDLQSSIDSLLNETNIENYETDLHDKIQIQKSQEWPIHSFCFKLMDTLIDNLSLILIKDNKNSSSNINLDTSLISIICETLNLLVEILHETQLEWSSYNLNEILMNLFQKFNLNLKFLHERSNVITPNRNLNILNRLVYIYLVVTFYKILNLMQSIDSTSILMPSDLTEILFLILNDVCLIESFKPIESTFLTILSSLDKTLHDIHALSNEICDSMRCSCEFMMKYDHMNLKVELLEMAKKSLNYMDYHVCVRLAEKMIEFSSKFCLNIEKDNEKFKSDIEYIVTSCMMSKNEQIRLESYTKIYKIVNESLNVQVATEINSKRYKGINFLLFSKIFYQFITFGLFDKSSQVRKVCENILCHLLQCELLIPETFRLKLTQLIVIYMPFIQCFAGLVEPLGQCILNMSDDMLTPTTNGLNSKLTEDGLKLFLSPAIERLRCSLRYLYSKEKNLRKKGYQQSIGFLTKYHKQNQLNNDINDESTFFDADDFDSSSSNSSGNLFNLNDFYMKYLVEKFCDMTIKLKRPNRTFLNNNYSISSNQQPVAIFQTDNLLKIYNIFTSDSVENDLKKNAGDQLAIMIATGDHRLHRAFINLDGVNYCLRYLKNSILKNSNQKLKQHLFLNNLENERFDRIQFSCINCLCNVFYWNKDIRQLYLFDIELYRLIIKCLIICFNSQIKYQNESSTADNSTITTAESILYSNCQEDLSTLLFTIIYHQVSCLDYYHSDSSEKQTNRFDLSSNLKGFITIPFSINSSNYSPVNELNVNSGIQLNQNQQPQQFELKQLERQQFKAYELNYKLDSSIKHKLERFNQEKSFNYMNDSKTEAIETRLKDILDNKFRLYWNFKWHGGSMIKLCNDLLYNESFVQSEINSNFSRNLCLNDANKFLVKYSSPVFIFKQLCNDLNTCLTHHDALNTLDLMQILIAIINTDGLEILGENQFEKKLINDDYDVEFYIKNSLSYYFNKYKCDWHLALNRFSSIIPSTKSRLDQVLFSNSYRTIAKMLSLQKKLNQKTSCSTLNLKNNLGDNKGCNNANQQLMLLSDLKTDPNSDNINSLIFVDKWLFNMIYNPSSSLLGMVKSFLGNYETDEIQINSYLLPLCEFIKVYFERVATNDSNLANSSIPIPPSLINEASLIEQFRMPSIELLKICIDQMQACEVEKFRNLNKLSILINLIGSLLRINSTTGLFTSNNENPSMTLTSSTQICNHNKLYIQLIKSLVQTINIFNNGRGGLSLSFMGNFITKSAHTSLLQLVKNAFKNADNNQKTDVIKAVLCLKDQKSNLIGSSWLIPLLLHREPQIRSISFCLISLLVNVSFARAKLLTNQTGIWSIALNVLLNRYESSIVRAQACAFLINLTQSISSYDEEENDDTNISITCLQMLLNEVNFYPQIANTLTAFYPFETYSINDLIKKDEYKHGNLTNDFEDASICSPLLVSSICQLLYNLTILINKEAIMMVNNSGIMSLLVSYVKPITLFNFKNEDGAQNFNVKDDLIEMLAMICRYLNLCCQLDNNCVFMLMKHQNKHQISNKFDSNNSSLVYDLIECLEMKIPNKSKLRPFLSIVFELLSTFLTINDEKSISESYLFKISKCWTSLTNYLLNDLLNHDHEFKETDDLVCNGLKFYSIYLAKLTQLNSSSSLNSNVKIIFENIAYLFDSTEPINANDPDSSFGASLCRKLIKLFDRYFLVDTNANMKTIISSMIKGLFSLSQTAKQVAVDCGLIETLIEHLKYNHSKLNLKSLSLGKGPLKENSLINDMQQTLLILKYLMCNNLEIKESVTKNGLHSIIHSFWCWALQDQNLLKASLSTLCTLTANNKLAINLMTQSNVNAQTSNAQVETRLALVTLQSSMSQKCVQTSGLTLLHSIIKSLQKSFLNQSHKSSFIIQKYSFALLTNCAQSSECKNIIWKSNLLLDFTTNDIQTFKTNFSKFNLKTERSWLNFLLSLSFTQDGQQFFMKVDSLLTTIIKLYEFYQQHVQSQPLLLNQQLVEIQYLCLLTLRNMAFNQSNKSKLISNSDYVNLILQALKVKNEKFQLLGLSALDSLLYDYQKAKVIFKNANALKYLVEINEFYSKSKDKSQTRIISITSNLIKTLNES